MINKTGQGEVIVPKLETIKCKDCGAEYPAMLSKCPVCGSFSSNTQ